MSRFLLSLVAFVALWIGVACLDVSSPVSGIAGISPIIAPTPSVVTGDSLSDSLGNVASLRVFVFGPNGETITDAVVRFVSTDTSGNLEVDSISGKAFGDSLSPIASVVAQVTPANGGGVLQTPRLLLPVVPIPDSVTNGGDPDTFVFDASTPQFDSLSANLISPSLSVIVRDSTGIVVPSYLVSFHLIRWPGKTSPPSVLLVDDGNKPSTVDTTDGSGNASRRLRVRTSSMPEAVLLGGIDTVVVQVLVRYRGKPLKVVPSDSFVVLIRGRV